MTQGHDGPLGDDAAEPVDDAQVEAPIPEEGASAEADPADAVPAD